MPVLYSCTALLKNRRAAAILGSISLDRLDKVRDQVVAQLKLHVDVGEGLSDPLPHGHELVVDHDDPQHEDDDHSEYDPAGRGHEGLLAGSGKTPWKAGLPDAATLVAWSAP